MQRIHLFLLFGIFILLTSCQQKALMPNEVARDYWDAVKSGNSHQLKNLTINDNGTPEDQLIGSLKIKSFKIKRTIIEDQKATVEVDLELDEADSILIPVNTVLIKQNKIWRVDHKTTVASLRNKSDIGDAIAALHQFSRMLSKDLDQSLTQLERQAPVIRKDIKHLMEKLSARVPTLKKEFQKLIEDIDKSVKPLKELGSTFPPQQKKMPNSPLPPRARGQEM